MAASEEYSLDGQIEQFFQKTTTTRQTCDDKVKELCGFEGRPAPMQGHCSYTVFAGADDELVFQFRLESLVLDLELVSRAKRVYGSLVPDTLYHGSLGSKDDQHERLLIYGMAKVPGISYIESQVTSPFGHNAPERMRMRSSIMGDFASFFASAWKSPITISQAEKDKLRQHYLTSLELLLKHLPVRFHPAIEQCIEDMPLIFSLPMVLNHQDLNASNIIVDEATGHMTGLIDWAEADVSPFGYNLRMLRDTTGMFWLGKGWRLYDDHDQLHQLFWSRFEAEIGGLTPEQMRGVQACRNLGCLMVRGFTRRLANDKPPVPIADDDLGRYDMLMLDGFLVNPETKLGLHKS